MNKEQLLGVIRHGLTVAGGALIAKGVLDESVSNEIIGAIMSLVGVVWSFFSKKTTV
jgi:hypothetical protein